MIEVEIKLAVSNSSAMCEKLIDRGFYKSSELIEEDYYFDDSEDRIRTSDQAFRVRIINNLVNENRESCITFKGKKLDQISVTREELETKIEDPEMAIKILKCIGFSVIPPIVRKHRCEYKKDDITVCIDHVENLGDFMEFEWLISEESRLSKEQALESLQRLIEELGLSMQNSTRNSYLSMLQGISDQ